VLAIALLLQGRKGVALENETNKPMLHSQLSMVPYLLGLFIIATYKHQTLKRKKTAN